MNIESTFYTILTGAGFSKNFNGWTGEELKKQILEKIEDEKIKAYFIETDYETGYNNALSSNNLTKDEKSELTKTIKESYATMCQNMSNSQNNSQFGKFIRTFLNFTGNTRPFLFTLNQDLFLESRYNWQSPKAPILNVNPNTNYNSLNFKNVKSTINLDVTTSDIEKSIIDHAGPAYIKLHGSYGWYSSVGLHRLIIGKNKIEQIQSEPLLNWYYKIFKLVHSIKRNILIIGYSFNDEHINNTILNDAIQHKLIVISPSRPINLPIAENILHYEYNLTEVLNNDKLWLAIEREIKM